MEEQKLEFRLMTDLSGHSYTLVLEIKLRSFIEINPKNYIWVTNSDFQELYQKFIPLCESGHREYFKIEMETWLISQLADQSYSILTP